MIESPLLPPAAGSSPTHRGVTRAGPEGTSDAGSPHRASAVEQILGPLSHTEYYQVGSKPYPPIPLEFLGATLIKVGLNPPRGQYDCSVYEAIVAGLHKLDKSSGPASAGDHLLNLLSPFLDDLSLSRKLKFIATLKTVASWGDALEREQLLRRGSAADEGSWSSQVICSTLSIMAKQERSPLARMVIEGVAVSVRQASQLSRLIPTPGELSKHGITRPELPPHERSNMDLLGRCYAIPSSLGDGLLIRRVSSDYALVCEQETLRPVGYAPIARRDPAPRTPLSPSALRALIKSAPSHDSPAEVKTAWLLEIHERVVRPLAEGTRDGQEPGGKSNSAYYSIWSRLHKEIGTDQRFQDFLTTWDEKLDSLAAWRVLVLKDKYTLLRDKIEQFESEFKGELRAYGDGDPRFHKFSLDSMNSLLAPANDFNQLSGEWSQTKKAGGAISLNANLDVRPPLLNSRSPLGFNWVEAKQRFTSYTSFKSLIVEGGQPWLREKLRQLAFESDVLGKAALIVEIVKGVENAPPGAFHPRLVAHLKEFEASWEDRENILEEKYSREAVIPALFLQESAPAIARHTTPDTWNDLHRSIRANLELLESQATLQLKELAVRDYGLMATDPDLLPFSSLPTTVSMEEVAAALEDPALRTKILALLSSPQGSWPPRASNHPLDSMVIPRIGWWVRDEVVSSGVNQFKDSEPRKNGFSDRFSSLSLPAMPSIADEIIHNPSLRAAVSHLIVRSRDASGLSRLTECLDNPEIRSVIERNLWTDFNSIPRASQVHIFRLLANCDDRKFIELQDCLVKHRQIAPLIARSLIGYAQSGEAATALISLALTLPKDKLEPMLHGFLRIVDAARSAKEAVFKLKLPQHEKEQLVRHVEQQTLGRANTLLADWAEMLENSSPTERPSSQVLIDLAQQIEGESVVFAAIFKAALKTPQIDPHTIGELSLCQTTGNTLSSEDRSVMIALQAYNGARLYPREFSERLTALLQGTLSDPKSRFWLLKIDGAIKGFARFIDKGDEGTYFGSLNLDPAIDNFGLGGVFLEEALKLEGAKGIVWGYVAADNPARKWFSKFGFVEGDTIENFDSLPHKKPSGVRVIRLTRQPPPPVAHESL